MSSIWYLLALVLVGSALLTRRIPLGGMMRMALLWVAIFAILMMLFSLAQISGLFLRAVDAPSSAVEPAATPKAQIEGSHIRIPVSSDGHYWVEGAVNGTPVRFLIDSGASVTALSETAAKAAALNIDPAQPTVIMVTANGRVEAQRSRIATLAIGPVRTSDLEIVVSPAFGDVNVIGMNMLSRLKSWGVENGEMVLTP
ncbi:retropepsin-like aspartic protease family protein [Sphingobium cloacae]|nr:TIGR02281 family clan AA aspartic protease [Sphingobium cloacae]